MARRGLAGAVPAVTGLLLLAVWRRVPRWMLGAWALLATAVFLSWLVGLSWPGTPPVYAGLLLIASARWLRAEERRALG